MSFLYPVFLAGAAAIAIPIVLHLLRRDLAPEVPFSAVRLLRNSPIERSKRRRLRDLLLAQQTFRLVKEVPFPHHGCRVMVWKRAEELAGR